MASYGMLCNVALVVIDVSEELNASVIRVTRIGELGTTLAVPNSSPYVPKAQCLSDHVGSFALHIHMRNFGSFTSTERQAVFS
jgi:hypothetical protein